MAGKIKYYGLWAPIAGGVIAYLLHKKFGASDDGMITAVATGVLIGLIFQLYIWSMNQFKVKNGLSPEKLGWFTAFDLYDKYSVSTGKWEAMHPVVDERLLFTGDPPSDAYILGKYNHPTKGLCWVTLPFISKDARQEIYERLGCDYYLIGSSIHECLALPVGDTEPEAVRDIIESVNASEVAVRDVLATQPYIVDKFRVQG